jgi:hypothetical protein
VAVGSNTVRSWLHLWRESMTTAGAGGDAWVMNGLLQSVTLALWVEVVVWVKTRLWHTVHSLLSIWLSLVVWHALWVGELLLGMHGGGRHSRAAVLRVWGTLRHLARRLEWRSHAATHLLRHRAVWLGRMVRHLWVVVALGVPAAASTGRVASAHVGVAHIAMCRLR